MMDFASFIALFNRAVLFGTVIMLGCLGETLTEKCGNLNLGIPGVMYMGGIGSLAAAFFYESNVAEPNGVVGVILVILAAFLCGALGGLIYSFLTTTLRVNQNVTGLALTIFGSGLANFFGGEMQKLAGGVGQINVPVVSGAFKTGIPGFAKLGAFGKLFLSYGFFVYVTIVIAIILHLVINKTRIGLNIRSIGENPATADAQGINVIKYKYLSTCIGTGIAGLGGLFYVMDYTNGTWANDGTIEGLGWLAVALVIFTVWKPVNAIWGAYIFGMLYWLYNFISGFSSLTVSVIQMFPYLMTIIVLIVTSIRSKKENMPPESLGLPYFREER